MHGTSEHNDEDLIRGLRGSRAEAEAAFGRIYELYSARLMAYCSCILGDKEQAEDIFQETFLRFHKQCQSKKEIRNIAGLLITIARNLCLNAKRDRKTTVPIENLEHELREHMSYERTELLGLIMMALELLDFKHREAFVLRKIDGFSLKEIAEICNLSVEGAKTRVNRARKRIQEILAPYLKDLARNSPNGESHV